jgi:hypothetical protein
VHRNKKAVTKSFSFDEVDQAVGFVQKVPFPKAAQYFYRFRSAHKDHFFTQQTFLKDVWLLAAVLF